MMRKQKRKTRKNSINWNGNFFLEIYILDFKSKLKLDNCDSYNNEKVKFNLSEEGNNLIRPIDSFLL